MTVARKSLIADRRRVASAPVRRLLLLSSSVVFFDTLFFAALTPLLPHYVQTLHMGKTGAGVLAATYPLGALVGAIPSGMVAVAACTVLFGLGTTAWQLDLVRFVQGLASAFSWTGALAWLVAGAPARKRGALIGTAFGAATAGALFGPVLGGAASIAGIRWTFGLVGVLSLGLAAFAALTRPPVRQESQPLRTLVRALSDTKLLAGIWFVLLPGLLFGALGVLAPLRLSHLGYGAVAIGGVFLCSAAVESVNDIALGRVTDRFGTLPPLLAGLAGSVVIAALLPLPTSAIVLAALVVLAGLAFSTFFTPGMTQLSHLSEARGLDHGYTFALVNLAWAPGQTLGAAGGGALGQAAGDAAPYLCLAGVCTLTLAALWRSRESTVWTTPSAKASNGSSSRTTGAA
jgi:MFS family permease